MGSACASPLSVLLPDGHHSARTHWDLQPLLRRCRVRRGEMVWCRPTYDQYISSCFEEQTPGAELTLSQKAAENHAAKSHPY